jgi:hypothetical protein
LLRLTPHHFMFSPSRGPASVLKHRFERSPEKKGKEFVKFVDGLANVAGNRSEATTVRVGCLVEPLQFGYSPAGAQIDARDQKPVDDSTETA